MIVRHSAIHTIEDKLTFYFNTSNNITSSLLIDSLVDPLQLVIIPYNA